MAIEAPYSSFKVKNCKLYAIACIIVAVVLAYDGYCSKYDWSKRQSFYNKHTDSEGNIDGTIKFNRNVPFVLLPLAAAYVVRFFMVKDRKIVADDNAVIFADKTVTYDSIEKINKTHFDSKGFFILTYKDAEKVECDLKFSDRYYDNLPAILDHIVTKIS